ncbi:MAG TPA: SRPBCC family protein [Candidatus Aphodoplasma excrementigallinarum]|uniref:SRPBCC family protein n=1 Tax=Candidatus Aphodoplasma excrementigallinarum TaxID=2840673 RepID=A0A9D1NGP2_9FIRM|nr:SRPBCC family protein [Candidatus Aphodoplasma excrementigallinarum]
MPITVKRAIFARPCEQVWEVVTSLTETSWRSDISRCEVIEPGKRFVEYTNTGIATAFTITACEPMRRYEFDMENENMQGHWTGMFYQRGAATEIEFTENVTAKKFFLRPFVKAYLKRQQAAYVSDLKRALGLNIS